LLALVAALFVIPFQTASADIFQYTDDSGVTHFSNVSTGGKKFRKVQSEQKPAERRGEYPRRAASSAAPVKNVPAVYADMISSACDRHGVDPSLVRAIVKVESDFNPFALSRKGAMGLMQLMPQTALDMNVQNTFNPHENIDGGVKYLRYLIDRYEGNLPLALAAYNSGETAVKKWGTVPPFPETQNYVQRILKLYNGTGSMITPHYTIYVGYGDDGALLLTDDPYKHKDKNLKRKTSKSL
jgi:soluble lytic murein transglycosylase